MPSLAQRSADIELMDDLECSGPLIDVTLRELDVINQWLGGNAILLKAFKRLMKNHDHLHVADLGCGGGDQLRLLSDLAKKSSKKYSFTGIDANPNIVTYAKKNTSDHEDIDYLNADIFSEHTSFSNYHLITATLFYHHFTSEQLIAHLNSLHQEGIRYVIINDLHRHWLAYHSIKWITRLFSSSKMVKHDAPLSVARGFKKKELEDIINKSSGWHFTIRWKWAFRWLVTLERT